MTGERMEQDVILGAGPVGQELARQLLAQGRTVRIVSRSGSAPAGAEHLRADLSDPAAARAACAGARTVYHAAAPAYHRWLAEFPALQDSIVAAAAATDATLVVVENTYGYGVTGDLHEGLPLTATTRKGALRAGMTGHLFKAHAAGRVRAVVARASDFLGPGVRQSALGARFFPPLLAGRKVGWLGDPDAPHSFTYVPDLAAALIRLARAPDAWGRAWHVPSLPARSARQIATEAALLAGAPPPRVTRVPRALLRLAGLFDPDARETVEMVYQFEAPFRLRDDAFVAAFGQQPTGWSQALAATLGWWQAQTAVTAAARPVP